MKKYIIYLINIPIIPLFLLAIIIIKIKRILIKHNKPRLIWGPIPLLSNKYWSIALKKNGYKTLTLMEKYYTINNRNDFNLYYDDLFFVRFNNKYIKKVMVRIFGPYFAFLFATMQYDIFHHHFSGGFLYNTPLKKFEAFILKFLGIRIIITGYGSDFYRLSKIINHSWHHGYLSHYPQMILNESFIQKDVDYWVKNADCIINGFQIDGLSRWDLLPYNIVTIDEENIPCKSNWNNCNGHNGVVTIAHSTNHRILKGTEFLIKAINELKSEGLKTELIIFENKSNKELISILYEKADILVDQLILGYALSAIEGMAIGLPVISNLSDENVLSLFRRYSYLNECPIYSSTPEQIKEDIKLLVENPDLRKQLGIAGREYVEKYHSNKAAAYMFEKIYEKIYYKKDVDLINLFHPLNPNSYNNKSKIIKHPLKNNRLQN